MSELAADGLSNKQIAAALYVTVNTVEVHLAHVREARRSFAQSARQAAGRGLMSDRGSQ